MDLGTKRKRIVEGSCWPCKRRRVKCDLATPACRRCILSGATCNYNALNLRWSNQRIGNAAPPESSYIPTALPSDGFSLATNEKRALDYFVARLWPLLSIAGQPCPPPVRLGLQSKPVLHSMCVFADSHRALQEGNASERSLTYRRLSCLASIRQDLDTRINEQKGPSSLLTAVVLLYFLDGFVDCTQQHASTQFHHAGAIALLEQLGGFQKVRAKASKATTMLLSEFATTDLLGALLTGSSPYLSPAIWRSMELQPVWWEATDCNTKSFASTFETMAEMSLYFQSLSQDTDVSLEKVAYFERILQPNYILMGDTVATDAGKEPRMTLTMATYSLCRAFQHVALIYLYRAISNMPTCHALVQQHVHACLECIRAIDALPEVQKCALFPLYVAGAHALTEDHRTYVLEKLDSIYITLRFESVLCVRSSLNQLWNPCCEIVQTPNFCSMSSSDVAQGAATQGTQSGTWSDTFKDFRNQYVVF